MDQVFWTNVVIYILFVWSLFWKGIALWRAAQLKQRNWFVVMLVLNTAGILEIIYLFRFAKKRLTWNEVKSWKNIFLTKTSDKK
jgi:predicted membrane channel-forming protein YqfA (hemolysin III family)